MGRRKQSKKLTPRQVRRNILLSQKRKKEEHLIKVHSNVIAKIKLRIKKYFRKLSKLFFFIFLSFILVLIAYLILGISKPQKIKAEIFIKDNFELSLNDYQDRWDTSEVKITPLCGCLVHREHRGIQFFSNSFFYEINDSSYRKIDSIHQYEFLSPQDNNGVNPQLEFKFEYYLVKSDNFDLIKIENLLKEGDANKLLLGAGDTIIKKVDVDSARHVSFFTKENKLKIYTSDSFPIAALLPTNNSKIKIEKFHHPYERKDIGFEITEDFDINGNINDGWDIPSIDVFGPKIAVFTKPGLVRINRKFIPNEIFDTLDYAVLLFDVAPQLRIVHNKIDSNLFKFMKDSMASLVFHNAKGTLQLTSYKLDDTKFKNLQKRVDSMGVYKKPQTMIATSFDGQKLEMDLWGLPTVLNSNGIYAFTHHLSYLRTSETDGAIQYGAKSFSLNGQNDIKISNIKNDEVYNQPIVIPLDANNNEENKFKFSADGNLIIDEEEIAYSGFDSELWQRISFILGLITSVLALLVFFRDIFKRENHKSQQFDEFVN